MSFLIRRDQKTLVVLMCLCLLSSLLWDACCSIKHDSHLWSTSREAQEKKIRTALANGDDPNAAYRIPGSEVLMPFRIEINTAPARELQLLPGIGPALAKAIVAWRDEQGPFKQIDDIKLVPGIGPKKYEVIKKFIYIQTHTPVPQKKTRKTPGR